MALDSAQLAIDIQAVLDSFPATPAIAADGFAAAYTTYANTGLFGASTPVIPGSATTTMAATLATSLAVPGAAPVHAAAWSAAVLAFWSAPPIAVVGPQVGAVTSAPGPPSITAAMTAILVNLTNTSATAAAGIAAALHAGTSGGIIATVAPPPGAMVPIA